MIIYRMNNIDNGKTNACNIAEKIERIKSIILKLNMDLQQDLTTQKERSDISKAIQRIQIRLNNYQNKYDRWLAEKKIHF